MKKILVIEDEDEVRGMVVDALRGRGWQPVEAVDGETGLAAALEETPDLILCDIQMPKLDGYAVLKAVRANEATRVVPFVFLTGLADKPRMRKAMELGADDYLMKPFTVPELLAALDARFQKQAVIEETSDTKLRLLRQSLTFALPHELRTPLNTILGFSSLLADNPRPDPETVREYASLIRESAGRLRSLVEKFLIYAQVELACSDPGQRAALAQNLPAPTGEVIASAAARVAGELGRAADVNAAPGKIEHHISPAHLERLVRELAENALKFSEPGQPVQIESHQVDRAFVLKVVDFGRGFTKEQIQQISAHIQFDRKITEQQGTGLGLAICKKLAELYGGTVQIQSRQKAATTVLVQLPA